MKYCEEIRESGSWDIIVCGGGVAGVAAALAAARDGKKVLILEKTLTFGGLATNGGVNLFVAMCNGNGKQIIFGMADELIKLSWECSWTNTHETWRFNHPEKKSRLAGKFSPALFSLATSELLQKEGVEIYLDTIISGAVVENGHIEGIIVDSKSGREYLKAKMFIDATGDADLLKRAGVPTVDGKNYFTYFAYGMDLKSIEKALAEKNIGIATRHIAGGNADLSGGGQPVGRKLYTGVTKEEVTEYILENQKVLYDSIKGFDKNYFDLTFLPVMPQFRTTRRIDGNKTFTENFLYQHCEDSIGAVNDFQTAFKLFEIPYGALIRDGFDNVITAGRSVSASGYGWDIARVIPPAIITGQAAGNACCLALDSSKPIYSISVADLQNRLETQNVMIHFPDEYIPKGDEGPGMKDDNEHI